MVMIVADCGDDHHDRQEDVHAVVGQRADSRLSTCCNACCVCWGNADSASAVSRNVLSNVRDGCAAEVELLAAYSGFCGAAAIVFWKSMSKHAVPETKSLKHAQMCKLRGIRNSRCSVTQRRGWKRRARYAIMRSNLGRDETRRSPALVCRCRAARSASMGQKRERASLATGKVSNLWDETETKDEEDETRCKKPSVLAEW